MALRPCKECGQQISSSAKTCPHCGKKQGTSTGVGCLALVVLLVVLAAISHLFEGNKDTSRQVIQPGPGAEVATPQPSGIDNTPPVPNTVPAVNPSPPTASAETQTEPPFQEAQVYTSAEQLMIDRQTGGTAAAEKYLGKVVEVQGIVDTADSTGSSPSLSFKATGVCAIPGGNEVDCFWMAERERTAVAKLHAGDRVTVFGRFAESGRYEMPKGYDIPGCAYYIHLRNCTVKEPVQNPTPPKTAVQSEPNNVASTRKAAEQGNAEAQRKLAGLYEKGQGVPQDYVQAASWYRKAAEQGDAIAQRSLGTLYQKGQGVPQDYSEAYFWGAVAASGKIEGIEEVYVRMLRDDASSQLTLAEQSQVQERVRKWLEEHPTKLQ